MKEYPPADIRNFAVVGHASAGKTMLSEAMLACAGGRILFHKRNAFSTNEPIGSGAITGTRI